VFPRVWTSSPRSSLDTHAGIILAVHQSTTWPA
jgi:hypothetical protein